MPTAKFTASTKENVRARETEVPVSEKEKENFFLGGPKKSIAQVSSNVVSVTN